MPSIVIKKSININGHTLFTLNDFIYRLKSRHCMAGFNVWLQKSVEGLFLYNLHAHESFTSLFCGRET